MPLEVDKPARQIAHRMWRYPADAARRASHRFLHSTEGGDFNAFASHGAMASYGPLSAEVFDRSFQSNDQFDIRLPPQQFVCS